VSAAAPATPAARLGRLLPEVFQETIAPGGLLAGLLEVMGALQEPCERRLATLDAVFDPRRSPDAFVPFIARWVHFDHLHDDRRRRAGPQQACLDSIGHLRELVADAAYLAQWRGTARGLARFLATATGLGGFRIDEEVRVAGDDGPRPFHLRIVAPGAARRQADLVHKVIRMGKPAHVTYELEFAA
jgi:phage tail-like protein